MRKKVLGIDPGLGGAFVVTDGEDFIHVWEMPVQTFGKEKHILFRQVRELVKRIKAEHGRLHTFLERAVPFAMGAKSAFSYGKGFASVETAVLISGFPLTLVEPNKWTKEMHEGISADLKPKVRSAAAVERLFPQFAKDLPKKGKGLKDGPVDALLIAGWGLRKFSGNQEDFF